MRQSPYLNLLPPQQIEATLQMMGRTPASPLTPDIGREVCVRTRAKALVVGTIAAVGNQFLLTLNAQDCANGAIVAEQAREAAGRDAVLTSLGHAAAAFREELGESLASIQRYNQDIARATTRSLEALKAYSQGVRVRRTEGDTESLPFFRHAVQLDPEFALGHATLGTVLQNLRDREGAITSTKRAFELRDNTSERERLYIEARYYDVVERSNERGIESYRLLLATYPDDGAAQTNIGNLYRRQGLIDLAIHHHKEAVRVGPTGPIGHVNLGNAYTDAGRFDEARRSYETVLKLVEHPAARAGLVRVATLTGDDRLAAAQIAEAKVRPGETVLLIARAQAAAYSGRMNQLAGLYGELFRIERERQRLEHASNFMLRLVVAQAMTGRIEEARAERRRLLQVDGIGDDAWDHMLELSALIGDSTGTSVYAGRAIDWERMQPDRQDRQQFDRTIRALEAMAARRYQEAYDLTSSSGKNLDHLTGNFVAGFAALELHRWDDAARHLQTYVDFGPGLLLFYGNHAVGRIMLARAHAGSGRAAEALREYEEAFKIWRRADADLPLLVEARREYERLSKGKSWPQETR